MPISSSVLGSSFQKIISNAISKSINAINVVLLNSICFSFNVLNLKFASIVSLFLINPNLLILHCFSILHSNQLSNIFIRILNEFIIKFKVIYSLQFS